MPRSKRDQAERKGRWEQIQMQVRLRKNEFIERKLMSRTGFVSWCTGISPPSESKLRALEAALNEPKRGE